MKHHFNMVVSVAIKELKKGNNPLDCSMNKAAVILSQYQASGKKYFSGNCDNEDSDGRCLGHDKL